MEQNELCLAIREHSEVELRPPDAECDGRRGDGVSALGTSAAEEAEGSTGSGERKVADGVLLHDKTVDDQGSTRSDHKPGLIDELKLSFANRSGLEPVAHEDSLLG
jgi:hypothetical protein